MNYCLRCNKLCSNLNPSGSEPSVFCDECRSLLRDRLQLGDKAEAPKDLDLLYTSLWQEEDHETAIRPLQSASNQQPTPSIEGSTASAQTYGTFAHWRSREASAVKPFSEASLEATLSAPTHLTTLQSPDANVQHEDPQGGGRRRQADAPTAPLPQVSLTPESKQDTPLYQTDAWPKLEQNGRGSNTWTNQVDPLMARLDTNKFPPVPVRKEDVSSGAGGVTKISSPTVQRRGTRRYIRIALVVLAILVVLALAVSGAIAFKVIPQQHNAQGPLSSPVLTATASTAQLPSPAVQSTTSSSPSPAPGVGQPTASASSPPSALTPTSSTPATSMSGSPIPGAPTPHLPVESVSSSALTFNATQGQANPSGQAVKIANTGGSSLYWRASVDSSATSWLSTATSKGTVAAGQTAQVIVNVNIAALAPDSYRANVTITATDSSGMQVQGSPQVVPVTLTIAKPCALQVSPSSLSFTVPVLQSTSPEKTITLTETGNCAFPISWTASADQNWIVLSATSGTDSGSRSTITVHVNRSGMLSQYQGQITISAVASGGASVQGSPQTVSVTMNVSLL